MSLCHVDPKHHVIVTFLVNVSVCSMHGIFTYVYHEFQPNGSITWMEHLGFVYGIESDIWMICGCCTWNAMWKYNLGSWTVNESEMSIQQHWHYHDIHNMFYLSYIYYSIYKVSGSQMTLVVFGKELPHVYMMKSMVHVHMSIQMKHPTGPTSSQGRSWRAIHMFFNGNSIGLLINCPLGILKFETVGCLVAREQY